MGCGTGSPSRVTGPGEILPFLESRTSTTLVRHVITNLLVNVESEVAATSIAYVLNFQTFADGAVPETPAPMVSPGLIDEWHDSFALTETAGGFHGGTPSDIPAILTD